MMELLEQIAAHERSLREWRAQEERRKLDQAMRNAQADVLAALAQSTMLASVFDPDHKRFLDGQAKSSELLMASIAVRAGLPLDRCGFFT